MNVRLRLSGVPRRPGPGRMQHGAQVHRPGPAGAGHLPSAPAGAGTAAAETGWKDFYADPRLQKVLELALANNRDLRIAALNTQKAGAYYRIQRAALLPTVNAGGSYSGGSVSASRAGPVPRDRRPVGVSAWELDFFGRIAGLRRRPCTTTWPLGRRRWRPRPRCWPRWPTATWCWPGTRNR